MPRKSRTAASSPTPAVPQPLIFRFWAATDNFLDVICGLSSRPLLPKLSRLQIFAIFLAFYFFVSAGGLYNFLTHPAAAGVHRDPKTGVAQTVAILPDRITSQYSAEGVYAGFFFVLGSGCGVGALSALRTSKPNVSYVALFSCIAGCALSYAVLMRMFRVKMASYLSWS
jgi:hypothetical protein